jgi:hypothetical protein
MAASRIGHRARLALVAAISALALLAVTTAGAEAKVVKLSGQTTITPTDQVKQFFASNGVSVSPIGPATAGSGSFTFPIVAGFGAPKSFNGILVHSGGLRFTKGGKSAVVRRFVAVKAGKQAYVLAQVPGLRGGCGQVRSALARFAATHPNAAHRVRRLARQHPAVARRVLRAVRRYCSDGRVIVLGKLSNFGKQVSGSSATLTADIHLTRQAARLVNRALKTHVPAGVLLGSASSHVTVGG